MSAQEIRPGDSVVDREHAVHVVGSVSGDAVRLVGHSGSVQRSEVRPALVFAAPLDRAWYASQVGGSVEICDQSSREVIARYEPPMEWGKNWAWNLTQDGRGVYLARTS
ncbi:MAG: hypothetical protein SF069_11740 [Phycisphaerae bacterium]|nr:hypothetical protein [Phycisphaerae bacterium]